MPRKLLTPAIHPGPTEKKDRKTACVFCNEPLKGHPACALCSLLLHKKGMYKCTSEYCEEDHTGTINGILCKHCQGTNGGKYRFTA